jgi:hypothetical protein
MYENKIANSPNILMIHCGGEGGIRGSERCFIDSVKALSYWGYTIRVLRNRDVLDYEIAMYVTEIIDFQFPEIMIDKLSWKLPLLRYATRLRKLIAIINEQQPQVIYVNGGLPCQLAVPAGRICGVPVLCHFHHPAYKRLLYFWLVRYTNMCILRAKPHGIIACIAPGLTEQSCITASTLPCFRRKLAQRTKAFVAS